MSSRKWIFRALALVVLLLLAGLGVYVYLRYEWSPRNTLQRPRQEVPVVAAPVVKETITERVEATGTTLANESVEVTLKVTGILDSLEFEEGATVKRGDVLARLDDEEVKAQLAAARANLEEQRRTYRRYVQLLERDAISQAEVDAQEAALQTAEAELRAARVRVEDFTITAPFAGVVGIRRVSPGALVEPGTVITTLDDLSVLKLDFSVPEVHLSRLREGMEVEARSLAYPDRVFSGRVQTVDTRVDPITRSVRVRARLPNPGGRMKPGVLFNVNLITRRRQALMIPEESLVALQDRQYVYRVGEDNQVQQIEVKLGVRRPGRVEIREGLREGDRIVTEGTIRVQQGSEVRVTRLEGSAAGGEGS